MNGNTIQVLDKGFVRLVDSMGDDAAIVQAARVSYGDGTKSVSEDSALIEYLIRNRHTSPLEQVQFKFHAKMPGHVARQWVRHRTAKLNEISGRYSVLKDEFYVPDVQRMQRQSKNNKQGSAVELIDDAQGMQNLMIEEQARAYKTYETYLEAGMARELARNNMPLSFYTEWYWTMDLHNLLHFLGLRLDGHAQWEIRQYAQAIWDLIQPIVPMACAAYEEVHLYGVHFTRTELQLLAEYLDVQHVRDVLDGMKGSKKTELEAKLAKWVGERRS